MLSISNTLKYTALAGVLGVAAIVAGAGAASARDYTRCDSDGDCARVHCDWDGDNCYRENTYHRDYYHRDGYDRGYYGGYYGNYGDRRWVCDADGDRCHWVRY